MKIIPINLATHIASANTTLAYLLKIDRLDGTVYAFTSADVDCTIDGVLYTSSIGLNISSIEATSGFSVDNLELTTLDDGSTFVHVEIFNGVWRNALFNISRYNWAQPSDGIEPLMAGTVGEIRVHNGSITAELRGLQQFFQQPTGSITSKTCRARLGDALCTKDLTPYTYTCTVTSVLNNQIFTDSSLTPLDDFFAEGIVVWLTGNNKGAKQKVKEYTTGGNVTLMLSMFGNIQIGDTFTMISGCRKRLSDCAGKYGNVHNFQGEPHLPGTDALTKGK